MADEWTQTIETTWHQSGQPRPYADSVYDATIRFSTTAPWAKKWDPPKEVVRRIAIAAMNRGDFKMKEEERQWYETYAERFEKVGDSEWRVRLIQPYDD